MGKQLYPSIFLLLIILVNPLYYEIGEQTKLNKLGETAFFDITDFKVDEKYIYITDTAAMRLYLFKKDGTLVRSTGREGRGPGEFIRGPYQITKYQDEIYVLGYSEPYFFVYDERLNYLTNREFERSLITVPFLKSVDDYLLIVGGRMWEEDLTFYKPGEGIVEQVVLDFEIVAGLLYKYNVYKIGENWLFAWYNQNKFKVFTEDFEKLERFSVPGFPDKADGVYADDPIRPPNATERQSKLQQAGAFAPRGSFFEAFVVLDDHHFMVQLGEQTGGSDQALILNLEGEIVQEITLPESGPLLAYSEGILYMQDSDLMYVKAYEFTRVD